MPKISEIEGTPNPNAMKFILKEPLTGGLTRSYDDAGEAKDDALASALFDIEHVTNVFYVDHWITVTQDGGADWQELTRKIAEPLRAAPATVTRLCCTSNPKSLIPSPHSAKLQRREAEQRKHDSHDHEAGDHLRLAPPAQLEMMV